jgi:hypothetical protein
MRILFYLPVITPWWFARIVKPMMALLADEHEIHVLAPPPWRNTGIGKTELDLCADLTGVRWHIVRGDGHTSLRTRPDEREGIVAFVQSLAPDYVLCRSADLDTVRAFPGIVRHITEGAADPLALAPDCFRFTDCPFDHGLLPDLTPDESDALDAMIDPFWRSMQRSRTLDPAQQAYLRDWANLPTDRPILFLPLEYEHEENFYTMHRVGAVPNAAFVEELARRLDGRVFLALTNHPLNDLYVDNSALRKTVRAHRGDMRLLPGKTPIATRTSSYLMGCADGVILGDTKVYSSAGFHGTPMLRLSRFRTGDWLNAAADLETFVDHIADGAAAAPDAASARTWFAFHTANDLVDPCDPGLTADDLLARAARPVDPARWERNFAHFSQDWMPTPP